MLGALKNQLLFRLTLLALQSETNLLCRLSLLVEDGLSLTTETRLLLVVSSLTLLCKRNEKG